MSSPELDRLKELSEMIQEEETSIVMEHIAKSLVGGEEPSSREDIRKQTEREKYASVYLRSLRIHMCLDLVKQGYRACAKDIKNDWEYIIECLKFTECEWNVSAELLSNALDIVLLLDLSQRAQLLKQLDFSTRLKIKKQLPLSASTFFCALHMAEYCFTHNKTDDACKILQNLINLSEEYNQSDLDRHRECVRRALWYLVDASHAITCDICDKQAKYFEGIEEYDTSRFLWFYGVALISTGRSDEAIPVLKHCYELCVQIEGDSSWIGSRAGQVYHYSLINTEKAEEAEKYLWDALAKIDSGYYPEMDSSADFVAMYTLSVLLKLNSERQTLREYLPEILRFRDYCYENTPAVNSRFTVRFAENMLGAYYLETGDFLLAADHSLRSLKSPVPESLDPMPSDILIYTNLLLIYCSLNDADQMAHYYEILVNACNAYEDDEFIMARALLILDTAAKKLGVENNDVINEWDSVSDIYTQILSGKQPVAKTVFENVTYAQWVLDQISTILDTFNCTPDELHQLHTVINYFLDSSEVYRFNDAQKLVCYSLLAQTQWQLGSPDVEKSLEKILQYIDSIAPSNEARISTLRFVAIIYYQLYKPSAYLPVINDSLECITTAWQKATSYLNDQKVCQLLSLIQHHFSICYAILRTNLDSKSLYECVLKFKDLPALVGRERNRLMRLAPIDEDLRSQIFTLQDQLAAAELNDSLQGTNTVQPIAEELQSLEASFAKKFPKNMYFTEVTADKVFSKMPDRSAILEYYFSLNLSTLHGDVEDDQTLELDVFVTTKVANSVHFKHIKLREADEILEKAETFIEALQNPEDLELIGKKNELRVQLYDALIAPAISYLDGARTLFIAPDDQLSNLPFEILHSNDLRMLQDQFTVCRLVCGRDLLFYNDSTPPDSSCFILGNPDYEAEKGDRSESKSRGTNGSLVPVSPLPFSGIEAHRIAERCHIQPYVGDSATKYALQNALPCGIIHLATHGVYDEEMDIDSLYSSHLVFAGYNKWVTQKAESEGCGNGVLTADEISRMDLHKTELVVLSACQSGIGDISYRSARGLLSAFSAAGARWIISHLWEVSDFATPIFMDAFYDAYLHKGKEVPEALQYAKQYLRNLTVGEMRSAGWLDFSHNDQLSSNMKERILALQAANDRRKPFSDEFYWGGFTVHKSR